MQQQDYFTADGSFQECLFKDCYVFIHIILPDWNLYMAMNIIRNYSIDPFREGF
jgi:hypothetical protein